MASSTPSDNPGIQEVNQDRISNLPINVTDKIMKRLTITMAARTSLLSRKWRLNWLSHRYLIFDRAFWREQRRNGSVDRQKISTIISSILMHHNGPVHTFHLDMFYDDQLNVSQWISLLSRIGVKKIILLNWHRHQPIIPSQIYACKELVKLRIVRCEFMILPPTDFKGFAYLRSLHLQYVKYKDDHILASFTANCPRLTELSLTSLYAIKKLVVDVPNLESRLNIIGRFKSLSFNNVLNLKRIALHLYEECKNFNINILASSSKLQFLHFGGGLCKLLAAGYTTVPLSMTFKHLQELCLTELDLGDFDVFRFTIRMLQSCPFIKYLKISFIPGDVTVEHSSEFEYDEYYTLQHLVKVEIEGIKGTSAELKLIEYILCISVVLKELIIEYHKLEAATEVKLLQTLLRLPRMSTKAKLICNKK